MITHELRGEKFHAESRTTLAFNPHFHTNIELVVLREGTVEAHADAQKYLLEPGDVFLSFPNQVHSYANDSADEHCWLVIVPLSACSDYKMLLRQNLPATNRIPASQVPPQVYTLIEQMEQATGPYADSVRKGYWLVLLGLLLPHMPLTQAQGNEHDVLRSLLNYCIENLGGDLRLDEVAEQVCVGKYYISHLFRERLGIGFHEYVNMMRVNEAGKLLRETDTAITEVAYQVGFSCSRTFNRVFQKQMGCSPREYRKNGGVTHGGGL